jgi:ribose/xylose/arabinose/galactoside ABC-type transport system permease subunit
MATQTSPDSKLPPLRRLLSTSGQLRWSGAPEYMGLLVFLVGLCAYFAATEPLFASSANVQNLARQASVLAMLVAGQIFVVLAGGIDISVGAQVSLLSIVAVVFSQGMALPLALILTILVGCAIGLINGVLVTVARISPIITTIATWQLLLGFSLWYTNGLPKRNFDSDYAWLGGSEIGFLATPTLLAILVVAVAWFLLNRTRFGRYTYAVGGNAEASRLSGVRVRGVLVLGYVTCSFFTALGAITLSSRVSSGLPDLGNGLEITTIAAVFIGGVAWGGGAGSVIGAVLGVALLSVLSNGLDLNAVNSNIQTMVNGALILLAVGFNNLRRRGRAA